MADENARGAYRSATRPPQRRDTPATGGSAPIEAFATADGRMLTLRPIRTGDAAALRRGFARLTPEQVRLRTFHRIAELSPAAAERLTRIDPDTTTAYVAVDAGGEIRAEARLFADAVADAAEFGVAVDPAFTRQGLGRRLLEKLTDDARRRGVRELWGDVLAANQPMLEFVRRLGARTAFVPDEPGVVRVTFDLARAGPDARA